MKIVIDVSCLLNTSFISGIQRVVIETTLGLIEKGQELVLLKYNRGDDSFTRIDTDAFVDIYKHSKPKKIIREQEVDYAIFENSILLDLDSTWSIDNKKRCVLFPLVKDHGGKIVSYLYDIIPLNFPEYADQKLMYDFILYVSAIIKYADIILTETESGAASIKRLCDEIGIDCPTCYSTWLGADNLDTTPNGTVRDEVLKTSTSKYVLMVGTVEPRKNHKLVLDAFDRSLFEDGLKLIFAGREGWNNDEFLNRIRTHSRLGHEFLYFNDLNDKEIQYLYKNAFFLAFPSYSEGFGLPIIEAYQNGTPVIGADIDVTKEVAGKNGVFFKQDDSEDFIKQIKEYIVDNQKYEMLRERVCRYKPETWGTMVERISGILSNLMEDE